MPFLQALGYNPFDPTEVVPEFTADYGTKKGEKVDYALLKDGQPIILIECKVASANLDDQHKEAQLARYFSFTEPRFGILTNGLVYRFFSDLEEPSKMDTRPFLEFNILDFADVEVEELKRFTKAAFDLDDVLDAARQMRYTREIKQVFRSELKTPSEELARFFVGKVYKGRMTRKLLEDFTRLTEQALNQFIEERISDRLNLARQREEDVQEAEEPEAIAKENAGDRRLGIVTTRQEIDEFNIVRAILREVVDVRRIAMRDTRGYCGILLDDNNRKPICCLYFNSPSLSVGFLDEARSEEKLALDDVDGLFRFTDRLKATVRRLDS